MISPAAYIGTLTNERLAILGFCPLEGSGVNVRSVRMAAGSVLNGSRTDYWVLAFGVVKDRAFRSCATIHLTAGLPTLPKEFTFKPRWAVRRGEDVAVRVTMYGTPAAANDVTMALVHDILEQPLKGDA